MELEVGNFSDGNASGLEPPTPDPRPLFGIGVENFVTLVVFGLIFALGVLGITSGFYGASFLCHILPVALEADNFVFRTMPISAPQTLPSSLRFLARDGLIQSREHRESRHSFI